MCVVGKAPHAGSPGKKIARRLFSGGIFIGTRAMLATAVGTPRASWRFAGLAVALATQPPPDQSRHVRHAFRALVSRGQRRRRRQLGRRSAGARDAGYEQQPPTTMTTAERQAAGRQHHLVRVLSAHSPPRGVTGITAFRGQNPTRTHGERSPPLTRSPLRCRLRVFPTALYPS